MTDPNSAIPDHVKPAPWVRYEGWRVRLYEKTQAKNAHRSSACATVGAHASSPAACSRR